MFRDCVENYLIGNPDPSLKTILVQEKKIERENKIPEIIKFLRTITS